MRWLGLATRYSTWQACALTLQVVAGFLVVRWLSVEEYARFSIVVGVMTAAIAVADGGICNALTARAAAVASSPGALGSWMSAARRLALARAPWVIAVVAAATWLLLYGDHSTPSFAVFGALLAGAYIGVTLARMLWHVAARLCCPVGQVLAVDAAADCAKPLLVVALVFLWPVAAVALLVPVVISVLHGFTYRRLATPFVALGPVVATELADLRATTRQLLLVTVFFAFQGQIALWVVSALGSTSDVAGLGALGRFAMIYSLAGPFLANVLSPRFAAIADPAHLRLRFRQVFGAAIAVAVAVTALSALLVGPALALLGPAYTGFSAEFLVIMVVAGINFVAGVLNTVNVSRAWYTHYWLVIPVTLAGQGLIAALLDVSTLIGAITLSGTAAAALLLVYGAICARGMAQSGGPRQPKE